MAKKPSKDEEAHVEGEEGADAGAGKKKKMIMIAAAAVLVLGGGGGGYFYMSKKKAAEGAKKEVKAEPVKPVAFVDLPDMTLNLSAQGERSQFLRLKVAIEVTDQKMADLIKPAMPRVVDAFQVYMREMRPV